MSAFCDAQYYGDDCSVKCVPTNQCGGHYTCDNKGRKLCLPGWRGSECTEQIPGSDVDCSVYTDKTEFVPSEWEGLYTCPGENVQHFLLNITRPKDDINVVADLSIGTQRTQISGTYSSFIHALALQVESTFISWGKYNLTKLALETQEKNSSSMVGQLTFYTADKTKLICSVNPLNLKIAYFDGCDFMGTCVRYGKRKEEYYCCCNDGTIGQSCLKKSTTQHTTAKSTVSTSTTTAAPTTHTSQPATTETTRAPASTTETHEPSTTETISTHVPTTRTPEPTTSTPLQEVTITTEPTTSTIPAVTSSTAVPTTTTTVTSSTSVPTTTTTVTTSTDVPTTTPTVTSSTSVLTTTTTVTSSTSVPTTTTTVTSSTAVPTTTTTVTSSTAVPTTTPTVTSSTAVPTTTPTVTTTIPPVTTSINTTLSTTTNSPETTTFTQTSTTNVAITKLKTTSTHAPSTKEPTIKPDTTTEVPTTKTPSTTVVLTTQPTTTSTATSQLTTTSNMPPTTVIPTQTTYPTVSQPVVYRVNLLMVIPELDANPIMEVLLNSWIMENKDRVNLTANNIEIGLTDYDETTADGLPVTVLKYKVKTNITNIKLKEPSHSTIEKQLQMKYNVDGELLYTGSGPFYNLKYRLMFYVHGPGPVDNERNVWEEAVMSALNTSCATSGKCETNDEMRIVIRMTEEYVGDDGHELTEVSYFIEYMGKTILPTNFTDVSTDNYSNAFKDAKIKSLIYRGKRTLRHRFHYKIFVLGKVRQEDKDKFEQALNKTWFRTYPEYYNNCRDCYARIMRQEKYFGHEGQEITALIYYFYFRSILQVPMEWVAPNMTVFVDSVRVLGVNNATYELYTGQTYYRYRHHFSLLIEGMVDSKDLIRITDNLQAAVINFNNNSTHTRVVTHAKELMFNHKGDTVTNVVCFLTENNRILDSRIKTKPSLPWLHDWFVRQKVLRRNDQVYVVYSNTDKLYFSDQVFILYLDNLTLVSDQDALEFSITNSWNTTFRANVEATIIKVEMFIQSVSRQLVTGIYYVVKVEGNLVNSVLTCQSNFNKSVVEIERQLTVHSLKYQLHHMTSLLLPYHQHFELYFQTELSVLELQTNFSELLHNALKAKWRDFSLYSGLSVHFVFQEKVYIGIIYEEAWRVVYFLTYTSNNKTLVLYPEFVEYITELLLYQTLSWHGLNGLEHKLYTKDRGMTWYKNQHFNLLMTREVSIFDCKKIEIDLLGIWCKHLRCVDNSSLSIVITEQEKYVDQDGNFYWNLVYFIKQQGIVIDSRRYIDITVTKDIFKWNNVYEGLYEVVVKQPLHMWKLAHGFHIYTDSFISVNLQYLTEALLKAWYQMGIVSENCRCLKIEIIHQQQITERTERIIWEITYLIHYNGQIIHSITWPTLDPKLIHISTQRAFSILTNIDTKMHMNLLSFYSNYKLSMTDIKTLERQMINKFLEENTECKVCRCVSVNIISQEQVINSQGEKVWKINYQIQKDGKPMEPSTVKPIHWSTFNHTMTNIYGQKFNFFWSWTDWQKYIYYSYLGGLYVGTWVPPSHYQHFGGALYEYYSSYYKGKQVSVTVLNETKEYFTSTGERSWRVPFILRVDGQIVNPPTMNTTEFETFMNFTATNGQSYKVVSGRHTIDATHVFSLNLNNKVSITDYEKMKMAVISAWCTEYPEVDPSTVMVDITGQEELVDKTTGKSSWKLLYTLSVNGTVTDKRTSLELTNSHLSTHLNFTSQTGVTYSIVDLKSYVSTSQLYQLYFKSNVAETDFKMVSATLKSVWTAKLKELGINNVDVQFVRQKQVLTETGESIWKWEYILNINNSVQITSTLPGVSHNSTVVAFRNTTSTSGKEIILVVPSTSYIDYDHHFSIYVGDKVAHFALEKFKDKIIESWKRIGFNVTIDLMMQEELINKENGQSVWKLLYFVKKEGQVIDSRTAVKINTTSVYGIEGPTGFYRILDQVDPSQLVSYQWSSSVVVNHQFSVEGTRKMSLLLKQMMEEKLHLIEEKYSVCNQVPADIQFLLDSSGSVGPADFVKQKQFVAQFADSFTIGRDNVQIGVTTFATNVTNRFNMSKYSNQKDLVDAINKIPYDAGTTSTGKALNWVGTNAFTKDAGGRDEASDIVIVMTDGQSNNATETKQEARKLHQAHIIVFAIGIGQHVNDTELENIASSHDNVFIVSGFDALNSIQAELKKSTCKEFTVNKTVTEQAITNVTMEINRQEEYVTSTGERVWKLVYFVKVDGKLVPATSLPNIDLDKLVTRLNITGPRGQQYQVIKGDNSTMYNYRDRFSIFFTSKVTEKPLTSIQTALQETWETSVKEYSTCRCVSVAGIQKQNVEEFVDKNGKTYWRLIYFLKKNDTVVESMTHSTIDLDIVKQKVKGIVNLKQEQYEVVNLNESQLYRTSEAFSFFLTTEIGYNQTQKFEEALKAAWTVKQTGLFPSNNTEVIVNRFIKYVDMTTKQAVWKVEYYMKKDGVVIDPSVTPQLTHINLTFSNVKGSNYQIVQPLEVVDSRMRYQLIINRQIRSADLVKLEAVVKKYLIDQNKLDNKTNLVVYIPEQTEVIKDNRKYWMLSIFVKQGTTFIDSRETNNLNTTRIQSLIDFKGVNNVEYVVYGTVENYRRLDAAFSLYVTKAFKQTEVESVLIELKKVWRENVFKDTESSISINFGNQEWYLNNKMSQNRFSKLTYYLTVDQKDIHPEQVPDLGLSTLQKAVPSGHVIVSGSGLYGYSSLFYVDFTLPVLKTDLVRMEQQMVAVWQIFKRDLTQPKVEILHQDELVATTRSSVWRLWYRITSNNVTLSPAQEDIVSIATLQSNLNLTKTGSKVTYGKLISTSVAATYQYEDLFSIHLTQRLAIDDYAKMETKLSLLWQKTVKGSTIKSVKILKQEETVDKSGKESWKLSYHVATADDGELDTNYDTAPSFNSTKADVIVTNPLSMAYVLVDAKDLYRLTQAFTVTMNRRIYAVDQVKFDNAFKKTLAKTLKVTSVSDINLVVLTQQRVISTKSLNSQIKWKYNYVVNVSGNIMDAAEELGIKEDDLQKELNFTTPKNQQYIVMEADGTEISYTDLFYVDFHGLIASSQETSLVNSIKSYWQNITVHSKLEFSSALREDFIEDITGKSFTRYRFSATKDEQILYPSLMPTVDYSKLTVPGVQVSSGLPVVYPYSDCYKLVLQSQHRPINTSEIQVVLQNVWKQDKLVHVVSSESSVGAFGVQLTSFLYTVKNQEPVTPDMELEPDSKLIQVEIDKTSIQGKQYQGPEYRIQTLHSISFNRSGQLTTVDRQSFEILLKKTIANGISESLEHVNIDILLTKDYISSNRSLEYSRLHYKLVINNSTVPSWQRDLNRLFPNNPKIPSPELRQVFTLYIKGKIQDINKLQSALTSSWTSVAKNNVVNKVDIFDVKVYVDINWSFVTKVSYIISINNMDPEILYIDPPSFSVIEATLSSQGLSQCGCGATSLKKHYVYSKTIDTVKVKNAITTVWKNKNKDLSDSSLSVRVKPLSSRHRRAAQPTHTLVDDNGKEVTPIEYTVAVQDEEPQSLFVTTPDDSDIKEPLKQAGSEPCLCKPKLAGKIPLDGQTGEGEKPKVADAIKDAFVKENPDVPKTDLDVAVTGINNAAKDEDGNPVSEVSYTIGRKNGDVEDLNAPSTAHLQQTLETAGKTLHSRSEKEKEKEKENWVIPLAIALGILAGIIVIGIIAYIINKRRHQKRGDLVKRENDLKSSNAYDEEHFSNPAAYDNKMYDFSREGSFRKNKTDL